MHVPRPPKPADSTRRPKEKPPIAPGTTPQQAEPSGTELPMPHERDERMDVRPEPDPMVERAGRDLAEGQVDTDLRTTPGLDAERRERLLRPSPPGKR